MLDQNKMTMIELKWIEKYYHDQFAKTYALRNINLKIDEGEFVSIMRPSGVGRSSLLYIFGMLDTVSSGDYFYYEGPLHKMSERKFSELHKSHIGFVFQQYHLIDELTVYENIEVPLQYQKVISSERKRRVSKMLKRLNISDKKDLYPNQLSSDQRQRVAVARALVGYPKLILADEPTTNLDHAQSNNVMKLLSELNKNGTTVVIASKLPCSGYCEREIHLSEENMVVENFKEEYYV
jgi:putative ABC transport system ATP-binding protein